MAFVGVRDRVSRKPIRIQRPAGGPRLKQEEHRAHLVERPAYPRRCYLPSKRCVAARLAIKCVECGKSVEILPEMKSGKRIAGPFCDPSPASKSRCSTDF